MGAVIRVVVADDHPIWVSGLRTDLGDDFDIVGEAFDAARAIEVIAETKVPSAFTRIPRAAYS